MFLILNYDELFYDNVNILNPLLIELYNIELLFLLIFFDALRVHLMNDFDIVLIKYKYFRYLQNSGKISQFLDDVMI